jgi:DNA-binding transcriptional regulator YdaS (Cro superfamily)
MLADSRLTAMAASDLGTLARRLAPLQAAQAEQRKYHQRGGPRLKAKADHRRPLLSDADRVLITVIYLRQVCSQKVLAELLQINPNSIGQAITQTRKLLCEQRITFTQTTLLFRHPQQLRDWLDYGQAPNQMHPSDNLSHPSLTGMSRADLQAMTNRIAVSHAAAVEQRRHRRRDRLPGTRGGMFRQKMTDANRILATVLSQRRLCNQQTLADLFTTSRATIRNAIDDVLPLLQEDGYLPTPPVATTAPQPTCSHRCHQQTPNRRIESLRLHYAANLMSATPKASWPWVKTLLHSVYDQPDADSVHAQYDRLIDAITDKLPKVAAHLDAARADVLAFTSFPRELWRQIWSNNPPGAAEPRNPQADRRRGHLPRPRLPDPARRRGPGRAARRVDRRTPLPQPRRSRPLPHHHRSRGRRHHDGGDPRQRPPGAQRLTTTKGSRANRETPRHGT